MTGRKFLLGTALVLSILGTQVNAADNPHQAEIDKAVADKAAYDALTAAATAKKAQYEAELAADKARIGAIPDSGYTGAADISAAGAGGAEGNLLAGKAIQALAVSFAADIKPKLKALAGGTPTVLVFTSTTIPDFQAYSTFQAQNRFFETAFDEALTKANPATIPTIESAAALGLGLEAINKLLGFAKTDYKFIALTVTATDAMLAAALAGELSSHANVESPATYLPAQAMGAGAVQTQLNNTLGRGFAARANQQKFERQQAKLEKDLGDKPTDAQKAAVTKAKDAVAAWKAVADGIDAWAKQISTVDDKGGSTLAIILRQGTLKQKVDAGAYLLVVQVHSSGGAGYSKKNLWSSLGANPFFVMGGAVAGYTLYEGAGGKIVSAKMQPYHGGYLSIDAVQGHVNPAAATK